MNNATTSLPDINLPRQALAPSHASSLIVASEHCSPHQRIQIFSTSSREGQHRTQLRRLSSCCTINQTSKTQKKRPGPIVTIRLPSDFHDPTKIDCRVRIQTTQHLLLLPDFRLSKGDLPSPLYALDDGRGKFGVSRSRKAAQ